MLHDAPAGHECPLPQAPQYVVDVFRFVSHPFDAVPSQSPYPAAHDATAQIPKLQLAVALGREHGAHALPPVPQLLGDWLPNASQVTPPAQHPLQEAPPQLQAPPVHV